MANSLEEQMNEGADRDLGALVAVLDGHGMFDQADLIESGRLTYEVDDDSYDWNSGHADFYADLLVDPLHYPMVSEDVYKILNDTLGAMHETNWFHLRIVRIRPMRVADNWRERRQDAKLPPEKRAARNQGGFKPVSTALSHDGLRFGSEQEILVYKALRAKQKALPAEFSIGIMPGGALVAAEKRFWPDFVVTYGKKAGGIEVDGPHHQGRAVADRSRDNYLRDSGLAWVDRIAVEDTANPAELEKFVDTFLNRLLAQ